MCVCVCVCVSVCVCVTRLFIYFLFQENLTNEGLFELSTNTVCYNNVTKFQMPPKIIMYNVGSFPNHTSRTAAPAKSLQSCLTLFDPMDCSLPGFSVPGILQARTLEWVAISFSNAGKWKVKVKSRSRV